MKKILLIIGLVAVTATAIVYAATPTYKTLNANGNATTPSSLIFPAAAQLQIRIVGVNWASDTNNATLSFSGGAGAYVVAVTNYATTAVTNTVNSTNGLLNSSIMVLQQGSGTGGTNYAATMSSYGSNATWGAFIVLASGGFGALTAVGDSIYQMDTAVTIPIGATTNVQNGEAIYVANLPGRPVRLLLSPALNTNKLNSAVARYE